MSLGRRRRRKTCFARGERTARDGGAGVKNEHRCCAREGMNHPSYRHHPRQLSAQPNARAGSMGRVCKRAWMPRQGGHASPILPAPPVSLHDLIATLFWINEGVVMQYPSGTDFNASPGSGGDEKRSFRAAMQPVFRYACRVFGISGKTGPLEQAESATGEIKGMGSGFRPFPSCDDGVVTNEQVNKLRRELGV